MEQLGTIFKTYLPESGQGNNGAGNKKEDWNMVSTEFSEIERSGIDGKALDQIRDLQQEDGPDILGELIKLFLRDGPKFLGTMQEAVEKGDGEALRKAAHTFMSSSGTMGAGALYSACQRLEKMGRDNNLERAEEILYGMGCEYQRVALLLEQELKRSRPR
jgi:HPt (histidine-containing phosphotransfer) domain-containing protein